MGSFTCCRRVAQHMVTAASGEGKRVADSAPHSGKLQCCIAAYKCALAFVRLYPARSRPFSPAVCVRVPLSVGNTGGTSGTGVLARHTRFCLSKNPRLSREVVV